MTHSDSLGFSVIAWQLVVLSFGFELVTVGLEHSDDLELQGTDEENGGAPDDPDPQAGVFLTAAQLSVLTGDFIQAESIANVARDIPELDEEDGDDESDNHEDEPAELPDVVDLADRVALLPDEESDQRSALEHGTHNGEGFQRGNGTEQTNSLQDGNGDDSAHEGAAAQARGRRVVTIDTHRNFYFIYIKMSVVISP